MHEQLDETTWEVRVVFDTTTDDTAIRCLEAFSEATCRANMVWINAVAFETGVFAPCCLEDVGVEYVLPEACPGVEGPCQSIRGAAEILESRRATCIDIASYMAAQLRLRGVRARVLILNTEHQGEPLAGQYHVVLSTPTNVVDYTQDLLDGNTGPCSVDCGSRDFKPSHPSSFDPAKILAR